MTTNPNICLYAEGLFRRNDDRVNAQQCAALRDSGFTTVIIWALHVDQKGDLQFADDPVVRDGVFSGQYQFMASWINKLKAGGTVDRVLLSIGGWGVNDFSNMTELLQSPEGTRTLAQNFQALATALPIDGFDLDMEEWDNSVISNGTYVNTIASLTTMLSGTAPGMAITYCPYDHDSLWLSALQQVYSSAGKQLVSAYNLQCYSGGASNRPALWAKHLKENAPSIGIDSPAGFVVPGYACYGAAEGSGVCPSVIQSTFAALSQSDAGITGGFIWKSGAIFANQNSGCCNGAPSTPTAYAMAVASGLRGVG